MTETGPVGSRSWAKGGLPELPENERSHQRAKQGLAMPLIELRLISDDGAEQLWVGKSMGDVQIRGLWVASSYYKDPAEQWDRGWLRTGDVSVIESEDTCSSSTGPRTW